MTVTDSLIRLGGDGVGPDERGEGVPEAAHNTGKDAAAHCGDGRAKETAGTWWRVCWRTEVSNSKGEMAFCTVILQRGSHSEGQPIF